MKITLIRHGTTVLNSEDKIRGWRDVPLDGDGLQDAHRVAQELVGHGIDAIVCSDLDRAVETAQIVSEKVGAPILYETKNFRPWDLGHMTGKDVKESIPEIVHYAKDLPDEPVPGTDACKGESFNGFKKRFLDNVIEIVKEFPDKHIAIVSHHRGDRLMAAWCDEGMPSDYSVNENIFLQKGVIPGGFMTHDMSISGIIDHQEIPRDFVDMLKCLKDLEKKWSKVEDYIKTFDV